jgi:hypothetical protein
MFNVNNYHHLNVPDQKQRIQQRRLRRLKNQDSNNQNICVSKEKFITRLFRDCKTNIAFCTRRTLEKHLKDKKNISMIKVESTSLYATTAQETI